MHKLLFQKCVSIGVGLATVTAAITTSIFGSANFQAGWSAVDFVSLQSYGLRLSLFVWTTNTTEYVELPILQDSFESNFTTVHVLLGVTATAMECCGSIMDYAANDIMLFAAITMNVLKAEFELPLMQHRSNYENILQIYKCLQNISASFEYALAGLFKICHASNLLSCAYFITRLVSDKSHDVGLAFLVLHIFKVCLTYYLCLKASGVVSNKLLIFYSFC